MRWKEKEEKERYIGSSYILTYKGLPVSDCPRPRYGSDRDGSRCCRGAGVPSTAGTLPNTSCARPWSILSQPA